MQGRIFRGMSPTEILDTLRESEGYYLCNNERDVSQSDFKNRLMPMTTVRVAPYREAAGFFSLEVSGGASVHVDLMRKQVNPFERLRIARKAMPRTLLQTVCRGSSLFGYRHYPENVIRLTVRAFARYVDVWRVYDFLNHVPNLIPVMEEVQKAARLLMPSICFSTGPEHTDRYYVDKVKEILTVTGPDVIISIKNYAGLGTPKRITQLVESICAAFPGLVLHYHGCNTDGNDIGRMSAAVLAGAKIVDVADHGYGAIYGQAPAVTLIQALDDYGKKAVGVDLLEDAMILDLIVQEGRVTGALGLDLKAGQFIRIQANAFVIATGGWHKAFWPNTGMRDLAGDPGVFVRSMATRGALGGLARATQKEIDTAWEALKKGENPRIHTFLATSDIHLKHKLRMSREQMLELAVASVKHAAKYTSNVEFSAEDATRSDLGFLKKVFPKNKPFLFF